MARDKEKIKEYYEKIKKIKEYYEKTYFIITNHFLFLL
jgi:hypothetical protein